MRTNSLFCGEQGSLALREPGPLASTRSPKKRLCRERAQPLGLVRQFGVGEAPARMLEAVAMTPSVSLAEGGAPARLAGATRAEIARALAELGVADRERNMRVAQLWHWIYHRGAREFSAMRNISRPLLEKLERAPQSVPPGRRRRTGFRRRHAQMASADAACASARQGRRNRVRLHSGNGPRHALRLEPGRLHAQLLLLPYRHDAARPQSDRGGDRRAGAGGARSARRFSRRGRAAATGSCRPAKACARCRTSSSWAWASRSTISPPSATRSPS